MIPIISTLSYFSCEQMQVSQNEKGIMILQNQQPNIFQITIVGWYRLIGKSNQNYLLIQSRNSIDQNIIRIVYNPVNMYIQCSILDVELSPKDISHELKAYLQDKWFFIRIGMNLQDKISNMSYIYYTIMYEQMSYITQSLIKASQFNTFDNNNFEYFFGSTSYYPYSRSCAVSRQILAFLGLSNDSIQGPYLEISKFEMFLLPKLYLHFDFFMASSNFIYNLSDNFKMCQNFQIPDQCSKEYPYYNFKFFSVFNLNNILDFNESKGFILKFNIQINSFDSLQQNVILSLSLQYFDYKTKKDTWITFYYLYMENYISIMSDYFFENQNANLGFTFQYEMHKWYEMIINIQIKFNQIIRFFYIDGILMLIGSFKLYLGGFIQECDDCSLKIDNQECLQCANSSDYQEQGKYYSCKSSCDFPFQILPQTKTCSFIPDQGLCEINTGTDRFFSDQCTCPKGQYFDKIQKKCLNCLQYCTTCENAYSCGTTDNINYNGYCDKNSFNDGIKCVSNFLKIINRLNRAYQINLSHINCQLNTQYPEQIYQIQDDALKLGHGSSSFFFSFNFNLNISNFQINDVYSICYLKNQNEHIFSIISYVNSQQQLELQFIDSSQSIILKAHIEAQTDIWIGFYYDYLGINLLVKYLNEQNSFYSSDIKNIIKYNLDNPSLVFGIQSPLFQDKFPLCGNIGTNNWIVKGDLSMRSFINILFTFSEEDLIIIAVFNFLDYKENFQNNQSFIVNKIDPLINFKVLPFTEAGDFNFDYLKGFQFKSNRGIVNLNQRLNKVPFVIKLSITANYFGTCIQQYYYLFSLVSQENLVFSLVLKSNHYQYYLEICSSYSFNCKKSTIVNFNYLDPNILSNTFLLFQNILLNIQIQKFLTKNISIIQNTQKVMFLIYFFVFKIVLKVQYLKYSYQLTLIKFSILLNYVQDEFELEIPQTLFTIPPQFYDIVLGGNFYSYYDPIIFYSRLEVYTGGFYYVNYDNQDPCFVYINRQNMSCILPKQGYALNRDGVVILTTECNQNIQPNQPLYYYNKYTMMCQNSGIILPNCRNLNIIDFTCIQCIDSQMILSKNCSCPDGTYFDQSSQACQSNFKLIYKLCIKYQIFQKGCSAACKTCSIDQNNCLECKGQNQIPPLCNCIQTSYYIDSNINCQQCSQQCNSCIQNQSDCLTCSQGRINPPLCYCNPTLYLNDQSDPITAPCQRKSCPNKCLVCDNNNQCVLCRGDRVLPPYCICTQDYYDDPLIEQELCQKCEEGFYFDDTQQQLLLSSSALGNPLLDIMKQQNINIINVQTEQTEKDDSSRNLSSSTIRFSYDDQELKESNNPFHIKIILRALKIAFNFYEQFIKVKNPLGGEIYINCLFVLQSDQHMRNQAGQLKQELVAGIIHEIFQALVFSQLLYQYYVNSTPDQYGINQQGKPVLAFPEVLSFTQQHFDCSEITQVYLENSDITWSGINNALLKDSGWYDVNMNFHDRLFWDKGKWCDFYFRTCLSEPRPNEFCVHLTNNTRIQVIIMKDMIINALKYLIMSVIYTCLQMKLLDLEEKINSDIENSMNLLLDGIVKELKVAFHQKALLTSQILSKPSVIHKSVSKMMIK
ncbi:hypothetical protein ABPG72_015733 [Tetrahymena utriculariae]